MNNNNWKEEFDKEFTTEEIGQKVSFLIKGFISNLLSQQRKEILEEILKDLLSITKGIDADGTVYVARQIDYVDIESLFGRYEQNNGETL